MALPSWLKLIGRREPLPAHAPVNTPRSDGLSIKVFGSVRRRWPIRNPPLRGPHRDRTTVPGMRVAMMTREYPPEVYGGAGVHVTELVAQLRRLCEVDVHCMGAPRPGAFAHQPDPRSTAPTRRCPRCRPIW